MAKARSDEFGAAQAVSFPSTSACEGVPPLWFRVGSKDSDGALNIAFTTPEEETNTRVTFAPGAGVVVSSSLHIKRYLSDSAYKYRDNLIEYLRSIPSLIELVTSIEELVGTKQQGTTSTVNHLNHKNSSKLVVDGPSPDGKCTSVRVAIGVKKTKIAALPVGIYLPVSSEDACLDVTYVNIGSTAIKGKFPVQNAASTSDLEPNQETTVTLGKGTYSSGYPRGVKPYSYIG